MDSNSLISGIALGISLLNTVVTYINHTKIRSTCCGVKMDSSIDIEKTTPVAERVGESK